MTLHVIVIVIGLIAKPPNANDSYLQEDLKVYHFGRTYDCLLSISSRLPLSLCDNPGSLSMFRISLPFYRLVHLRATSSHTHVIIHSTRRTSRLYFQQLRNMSQTINIPVPGTNRSISLQTGLFINNEFVPSVDGLTIEYGSVH